MEPGSDEFLRMLGIPEKDWEEIRGATNKQADLDALLDETEGKQLPEGNRQIITLACSKAAQAYPALFVCAPYVSILCELAYWLGHKSGVQDEKLESMMR